jgi:hypothetical protein
VVFLRRFSQELNPLVTLPKRTDFSERRQPRLPAAVTSTPRASGTGVEKKSGNLWFFLIGRRFESQDFAGPLMAIARVGVPPPPRASSREMLPT